MNTRNNIPVLICLILAAPPAAARTFRAALPEIRAAAFYRISIPPHATAIAGPELHSLRINNAEDREQPYLIGTFSAVRAQGLGLREAFAAVPVAGFSQVDSNDKRSYIRIRFGDAYPLNSLRLDFEGPRFYSRIVRMPEALPDWHRRIHQRQDVIIDANLRARELLLVVENDDNPPLQVTNVHATQQARYATAWLEPGEYRLEYNDTDETPPRYDIAVLADSLAGLQLPLLDPAGPERVDAPSALAPLKENAPLKKEQESPYARSILMWCIIGVILTALVFATRALARRIGSDRDP